jgi:Tol biopolymer transport system component
VADSDGTNVHLTAGADAGRGMFPVWSPDGEKIAYIGRTQPNDPASINLSILKVFDLRPSTFNIQLAAPPVWSPDGSGLTFTRMSDGKMELWFYEISTGKTEKLFDDACCAGWISGGRK